MLNIIIVKYLTKKEQLSVVLFLFIFKHKQINKK